VRKVVLAVLLALFSAITLIACDTSEDVLEIDSEPMLPPTPVVVAPPTPGVWEDRMFTSEHMGFSFALPALWDALTTADWRETIQASAIFHDEAGLEFPEDRQNMHMAAMDASTGKNVQITYSYYDGSTPSVEHFIDGIIDELQEAGVRIVGTQGTTQIGTNEWTYISRELDIGNVVLRTRQFINIYDGYIRMITVNFGTESEELTRVMSMFIDIGDNVPEAATIEFSEDLIDSWFWDEYLDALFTYEFFADGTGTRGFVDLDENTFTVIPRDREIFNWRTSGNTLLIESELGADRWVFSLDEHTLTFNNLREPGLSMILVQVDYVIDWIANWEWEDPFLDDWLEGLEDTNWDNFDLHARHELDIPEELIGRWEIFSDTRHVYIFNEDGFGYSGLGQFVNPIEWGVDGDILLTLFEDGLMLGQTFSVDGDLLILGSVDYPDFRRMFRRVP
jgi:hypothetical protein